MRRFTVFTLLYLALAICLTAIIFQQPDLTPSLKRILLINAGILYLCAVFSTFRFWHQGIINSQSKLRNYPTWRRKLIASGPGLIIAVTILSFLVTVLTDRQRTDIIAQAVPGLTIILLCVESLFTRHQIQS